MDGNIKLALFAVFYTIATVVAYSILFGFGHTDELDWRFWVGCSPSFAVLLVFGYFAAGWKQVFAFSLAAFVIDMIFLGTSWHFVPDVVEPLMGADKYAAGSLKVIIVLSSFLGSIPLLSLGYLTAASKRLITRSRLR